MLFDKKPNWAELTYSMEAFQREFQKELDEIVTGDHGLEFPFYLDALTRVTPVIASSHKTGKKVIMLEHVRSTENGGNELSYVFVFSKTPTFDPVLPEGATQSAFSNRSLSRWSTFEGLNLDLDGNVWHILGSASPVPVSIKMTSDPRGNQGTKHASHDVVPTVLVDTKSRFRRFLNPDLQTQGLSGLSQLNLAMKHQYLMYRLFADGPEVIPRIANELGLRGLVEGAQQTTEAEIRSAKNTQESNPATTDRNSN